jgi:hypothetical protein
MQSNTKKRLGWVPSFVGEGWLGLLAAVLVIALAASGALSVSSVRLYDDFVRWLSVEVQEPEEVVLVPVPASMRVRGDDYWLLLLETLLASDVHRIGFMQMPEHASGVFYANAASSQRVVFGRTRVLAPDGSRPVALSPLPAAAASVMLRFGVTDTLPQGDGIYRRYLRSYAVDGADLPGFASLLAGEPETLFTGSVERGFNVNFLRVPAALPSLSAQQILEGGADRSLLADKTVLVGLVNESYMAGVRTPLDRGAARTTPLEAQGWALRTLLRGDAIGNLPSWAAGLLLVVLCAANAFIYRRLSVLSGAAWTLVCLLAYGATTATLLVAAALWLPLLELALAQTLLWALVVYGQVSRRRKVLTQTAEDMSKSLAATPPPADSGAPEDVWRHLGQLASQTLEFQRMFFVELGERGKHARVVHTAGCAPEDVAPIPVALDGSPYQTAMAAADPVRVTAPVFNASGPDEQVYLVALRVEQAVVGIWAIALTATAAARVPMFASCVREFAERMAEVLARAQQRRQLQRRSWWQRALTAGDSGEDAVAQQRLGMLQSRMRALEDLLDSLDTAVAVYDSFGRPAVINGRMRALARQADIAPERLSALEFAMALTHADETEAKGWLRQVILPGGRIGGTMRLAALAAQSFRFAIRPLVPTASGGATALAAEPASLLSQGFVFELVSVTDVRRLYDLKDEVLRRVTEALPGELARVRRSLGLLENPRVPPEHRERLTSLTAKTLTGAARVLADAEQYLSNHALAAPPEHYPVKLMPLLREAIADARADADARRVNVAANLVDWDESAVAEPQLLTTLFRLLLRALIVSAPSGGDVTVFARQEPRYVTRNQQVTLWFSNATALASADTLQAWSDGHGEYGAPFEAVQRLVPILETWGGTLESTAVEGQGLTFRLRLRGFI